MAPAIGRRVMLEYDIVERTEVRGAVGFGRQYAGPRSVPSTPAVRGLPRLRPRNREGPLVAPAIGLEPMTKRLTVARSTN